MEKYNKLLDQLTEDERRLIFKHPLDDVDVKNAKAVFNHHANMKPLMRSYGSLMRYLRNNRLDSFSIMGLFALDYANPNYKIIDYNIQYFTKHDTKMLLNIGRIISYKANLLKDNLDALKGNRGYKSHKLRHTFFGNFLNDIFKDYPVLIFNYFKTQELSIPTSFFSPSVNGFIEVGMIKTISQCCYTRNTDVILDDKLIIDVLRFNRIYPDKKRKSLPNPKKKQKAKKIKYKLPDVVEVYEAQKELPEMEYKSPDIVEVHESQKELPEKEEFETIKTSDDSKSKDSTTHIKEQDENIETKEISLFWGLFKYSKVNK